jgi:hypothetical protein
MMLKKYCAPAFLVGLDYDLPSDPAVANSSTVRETGCNRLVCADCNAQVRHADGRWITSHYPPTKSALKELYESSQPEASELLGPGGRGRAYFCLCAWAAASGSKLVGILDQMWLCDGHPQTSS